MSVVWAPWLQKDHMRKKDKSPLHNISVQPDHPVYIVSRYQEDTLSAGSEQADGE